MCQISKRAALREIHLNGAWAGHFYGTGALWYSFGSVAAFGECAYHDVRDYQNHFNVGIAGNPTNDMQLDLTFSSFNGTMGRQLHITVGAAYRFHGKRF